MQAFVKPNVLLDLKSYRAKLIELRVKFYIKNVILKKLGMK